MISYIIYDLTYMRNLKKKGGGEGGGLQIQKTECWQPDTGVVGVGKKSEGSQREKNSSCKISKS